MTWAVAARLFITTLVFIALAFLALRFLSPPFFGVGLVAALYCWTAAVWTGPRVRMVFVLLGSVVFAGAIGELYLERTATKGVVKTPSRSLFVDDPVLGWALAPGGSNRSRATLGDRMVYHVNQTINQNGHRIAPTDLGEDVVGCALFLVDSFVFGEGVEDEQAFPYVVGELTGGRYCILNAAAPGYGAEHMYAMATRKTERPHLPCVPTHVLYAALPHHVMRAAHKTSYSVRGPRFRLDGSAALKYLGTDPRARADTFSFIPRFLPRRVHSILDRGLSKSRVLRLLVARQHKVTESDQRLYYALVSNSFQKFGDAWPEAQLHILAWGIHPWYAGDLERFHAKLQAMPAKLHYIDDILPGYSSDPDPYSISPAEQHPNAAAHQKVAAYIAHNILEGNSETH